MFVELWKSIMWLIFIMLLYSPCSDQQNLHFFPLDDIYLEIVAGSVLNFPKCSFVSTIPNVSLTKADIFWVKGGVFRINSTNDPVAYGGNGIEQNFTFPFLQIHRSVLSDGGIYQCAVKIANQTEQPVFSDKFEVKVKAQIVEFLPTIAFEMAYHSAMLFNCKYNAQESLSDFSYWLFNGKDKYDASDTAENAYSKYPARRELNNMNQFEVPPLQIKSYSMIGSYQCVIFDKNTMEREFKSDVFVIPRQPDPVFVNGPFIVEEGNIEIGRFISIHGCEFETYLNLKEGDMYWIKDGMKKIYASAYLASETYLPPYKYRFSNLNIERINYTDHGYYQCAINIVGYSIKEIRSGYVDLKLPDTSNTKLSLKLNREWTLDYLNQSSGAFIDLKNIVEEKIKQVALTIVNSTVGISPVTIVQITELSPGSVNVISRLTITNVNDSMKLQLSNIIIQNINVDSFKQLNAVSVELISLDYCPKSSFGDVDYKGEYTFEQTLANQIVQQNCTYQSKGVVQRRCVGNLKDGPAWEIPDLSQCEPKSLTTKKLIQLSEATICVDNSMTGCSPINIISKNLSDIVVNSSAITNYHDVSLIANTLETIVNVSINTSTASEQVFKDVLQTIDSLLESNTTFIAESQVTTSSSTSILNTLTKFAELYSKQIDKKLQISNRNIAFRVEKVKKGTITLSAQQLSNDSVEVNFENIDLSKVGATYALIQIPSEVFSNESEVIHSYFFRYGSFFLSENSLLKLVGKNVSRELVMQSTVFSASVGTKNVANLRNPIILTFKRIQSLELSGVSGCRFWDESFETNIKNVFGTWLQDGCYKYEAGINTDEFYTCACDHLTNFALLLDVNQSSNNPLALKIITFIGCGISLVGLSLTLLTLFAFRKFRQKLPSKILICLCISLTGLLLTFLIGAEKTSPRRGCQVVAATIHFFILSSFCWMLVEAFNLYRSFVTVFKKRGNTNVLRNASIFAWGVPAVIVIIAGILKPDQLGNDKVCVIRGYPFYFGVLLPVCLILLVNFVVLVVTILSLTKRVSTGKEATLKEYYLSQARITFMCATLLGLSWLFAVLAVHDLSTVFQWLFCITTSLQGFFIFVFYILRNKEVTIEWRRCLGVHKQIYIVSSTDPKSNELSTPH